MLISVRHLVDRLRHPKSRADELASLRARARAQPSRFSASRELRASAERLRALREELSAALGEVRSCSECARGHPLPAGRWDGGHCCGGRTLDIFDVGEVAALKLGGTDIARLVPPRADHAGCVFRGPRGCSLSPSDRPSICVRYLCPDLQLELRERSDRTTIAAKVRALDEERRRFATLLADDSEEDFRLPQRPMARHVAVAHDDPGARGVYARPRARRAEPRTDPGPRERS